MNFSFRFSKALALVFLSSLTVLSWSQTVDTRPEVKTEVEDKVTDLLFHKAFVPGLDFSKWADALQKEKPKLDAAANDEEFSKDLNEALATLGDSHMYIRTPKIEEARHSMTMVGIGISQQTEPDGTVTIMRLVPGAPADRAGLVPGDVIMKVDGKKAEGAKGIAGPEGTDVKLTVKHEDGKSGDYTLTRAKFSTVRPEDLVPIDRDTAKLTIYTFDYSYNADNVEMLMRQAGAYKNLILDLRDNGGGAVVNLQHLLSMFLPADQAVGTFVNRDMVDSYQSHSGNKTTDVAKIADWSRGREEFESKQIKPLHNGGPVYKGNLVVLINSGTGSGSEIAAAALHDLDGAQLVGQKSAGAVLVAVIVPATNGFTLEYPLMDYVTDKGFRIEGNGLEPQVETKTAHAPLPNKPDEAVEKAQALFARGKLRDERGFGDGLK